MNVFSHDERRWQYQAALRQANSQAFPRTRLHGVALRTAMKAKAVTTKRRGREKQVTEMPEPEAAQQCQWRDLQPLLDQKLNGRSAEPSGRFLVKWLHFNENEAIFSTLISRPGR
jgi:hypothetical protein